jgi:hypothetical protein
MDSLLRPWCSVHDGYPRFEPRNAHRLGRSANVLARHKATRHWLAKDGSDGAAAANPEVMARSRTTTTSSYAHHHKGFEGRPCKDSVYVFNFVAQREPY